MTQKKIILGSQSPRRKEILDYFCLPFSQIPSDFDESSIAFTGDPLEHVLKLSKQKALAIQKNLRDSIILTADTIVFKEGKIFEKPQSFEEAIDSLSTLNGRWHTVYSGLTVLHEEKVVQGFEETKVLLNTLTHEELLHYLNSIQWKDKAGGYAIQKAGGLLVKRIDGCYYNVMGLPINLARKLLLDVGIDLWDYIKESS